MVLSVAVSSNNTWTSCKMEMFKSKRLKKMQGPSFEFFYHTLTPHWEACRFLSATGDPNFPGHCSGSGEDFMEGISTPDAARKARVVGVGELFRKRNVIVFEILSH